MPKLFSELRVFLVNMIFQNFPVILRTAISNTGHKKAYPDPNQLLSVPEARVWEYVRILSASLRQDLPGIYKQDRMSENLFRKVQ